jgi:hypothetical protein
MGKLGWLQLLCQKIASAFILSETLRLCADDRFPPATPETLYFISSSETDIYVLFHLVLFEPETLDKYDSSLILLILSAKGLQPSSAT